MPNPDHILIVDDSPTQRKLMSVILKSDGLSAETADSAAEALASIASRPPMAVVTDLEMPEMSGLDLVQILRGSHPAIPVILTTAQGSEDVAAEALRCGAASYVPKRVLTDSLTIVVRQVLSATELIRTAKEIGQFAVRSSIELEIGNEESLLPKVISRLEMALVELNLFDDGGRMQVAMALDEALLNSVVHGNLEVPSSLRELDGGAAYFDLIAERKQLAPYRDRRIKISMNATCDGAKFVITDEGPGFERGCVNDPTHDDHLEELGGRGLLMIDAFMDEVHFNQSGNQITMIKRPAPEDGQVDDGQTTEAEVETDEESPGQRDLAGGGEDAIE